MTNGGPTVCREGSNRLDGQRVAMVFVPGVMGTRIQFPEADDAWDPDNSLNMVGWSRESAADKRRIMDFSRRGVVFVDPRSSFSTNHAARVARGWGGLRWASYGVILELMEGWSFGTNQTPVYAYGYDWRQPVLQLGLQMAADLLGSTQSAGGRSAEPSGRWEGGLLAHAATDKCVLITHSMGGLVSRAALMQSTALRAKVVGVMHGVQPATGGTTLYRRLTCGMWNPVDGGGDLESRVLRNILGPSANEIATLLSACPGPFQLLPSNLLRDACTAAGAGLISWRVFEEDHATMHALGAADSVYDAYRATELAAPPGFLRTGVGAPIRADMRTRITGLENFHTALGSWHYENKTWAFYGTGENTDHTVHFDLPPRLHTTRTEGVIFRDTIHEGTRSDGTVVRLDPVNDLERRGYTTTVPGAPAGAPAGYGAHGDGTVPRLSGAGVFDTTQTADLATLTHPNYRFSTLKQYSVANLPHEPAYRVSAPVQNLVREWVRWVLTSC